MMKKLYYIIIIICNEFIIFNFCLDEPDKIKKEAFQIKLNEYTKRAEELKATLYVSKIKISSGENADNSSTSYDDDRYPTLSKNIFKLEIIIKKTPHLHVLFSSYKCVTWQTLRSAVQILPR